jgi:integrase
MNFRDLADWSATTPAQLVEAHLAKTANTARGYAADLDAFASWLAERDGLAEVNAAQAARRLIDGGRAAAMRTLIAWTNDMRSRHLSASTIRRRIASLKSLIALAGNPDIEVIAWQVGSPPNLPPAGRVRDVRGPERATVLRMFDHCRGREDHQGARDEAILSLLYYQGMRASEVMSIRMCDVDLDATPASVRVTAKRGQGRTQLPVCSATADAIERWLEFRGRDAGPLFLRCNRVTARRPAAGERESGRAKPKRTVRYDRRLRCRKLVSTKRLSYWGMRAMVRRVGASAGCRCWPHGLRHAAISHLAALTEDSPLWGVAFSRHKDVRAWSMYQDRNVSYLSAAEVLSRGQCIRRQPGGADN